MRIRTHLEAGCPAVEFLAERSNEVVYHWRPGVRKSEVSGRQVKRLFQLLALAGADEELPSAGSDSTGQR